VKVADGGHNMMLDNPVGFAQAVLSTGSSPELGCTFGHQFLLLESGRAFNVGQDVKCKYGSRREWQWEAATITADNGDGTFLIRWHNNSEQSVEGGYALRYIDEDVSKERWHALSVYRIRVSRL